MFDMIFEDDFHWLFYLLFNIKIPILYILRWLNLFVDQENEIIIPMFVLLEELFKTLHNSLLVLLKLPNPKPIINDLSHIILSNSSSNHDQPVKNLFPDPMV